MMFKEHCSLLKAFSEQTSAFSQGKPSIVKSQYLHFTRLRSRGFSALECLIYGHFYSIERACQWLSPDNFLSDAIKRFRSLADIAKAVDAATFE